MIYFITEAVSGEKYFGMYQQAVRTQLMVEGVNFKEISLSQSEEHVRALIDIIPDEKDNIWLLSYAQNPLSQYIRDKATGKLFGHVHGIYASLFEPARLQGYYLDEQTTLSLYDGLFVNSQWARQLIINKYPELKHTVIVSGFPFDGTTLSAYKTTDKRENMVVFNQRFSLDKLHILQVHLADILVGLGYHPVQLMGEREFDRCMQQRHRRVLIREARKRGMHFIVNSSKEEYYKRLARATAMITTPLAETLSVSTLEAAALNVTPIVPDFGPFTEYVSSSNRYSPYNIQNILEILFAAPCAEVQFERFHPDTVVNIYLEEMGLL